MASPTAGVDVGGTFTDVVVVDASAAPAPRAVKTPTTWTNQSEGVAQGLSSATTEELARLAHGTTTATNAVLERDVARTVLVTTEGFADVLRIGRQARPSLYDVRVTRPEPLVAPADVVTVHERMDPEGHPLIELEQPEIDRVVDAVAAREPEAIAVVLLFSYAGNEHERRLDEALRRRLDVPITCSSSLLPEFREYERASTCVLNAALEPRMGRYLLGLADRVSGADITVMLSSGGTAGLRQAAAAPVNTLYSGPAAGVVAAAAVAGAAGYPDAVAFDMGGTSTDVCLIRDGRPEIIDRSQIAGLPFGTASVAIHTVGAGGGSVAWIDEGGALRVGPRSAGAEPGPACYGRGGTEPTVTDAHCLLGQLGAERELGGGLRLDVEAARTAISTLPDEAEGAGGILTVVRASMARALRRVSTERGVDPGSLALVAYGGAGPLHATALARELGMRAVLIPPAPGVLSALGLLLASPRHELSRTLMVAAGDDLEGAWEELTAQAARELRDQGVRGEISVRRVAACRYAGQSHELRVSAESELVARFHDAHAEAYGYDMPDQQVQLVTAHAIAEAEPLLDGLPGAWDQGEAWQEQTRRLHVGGEELEARVVHRAVLEPGYELAGPALVVQSDTTTLLGPGDRAQVDDHHNLILDLGEEDDRD